MGSRAELDTLKSSVALLDILSAHGVEAKKEGRGFKARCPFHEDSTPSLSVTPQKGLWKCFSCGKAGDALSFLQLRGLSFPQALEELKKYAGTASVSIQPPASVLQHRHHHELLARVAAFYHDQLEGDGVNYLAGRGLRDFDVLRTFQVGYCAGKLPYTEDDFGPLQALGVLNEKGKETLEGCVVVPLRDSENRIVNLYGRRIREGGAAHRLLAGPRRGWFYPVQGAHSIIVVEGVLDALACYQGGFRNVVSLNGVNGLTEELKEWLAGHEELVLCLDSDRPGRQASSELEAFFTAQGLRCRTLSLPVKDPLEFFQDRSADEFSRLLEPAVRETASPDKEEVIVRSPGFIYRARALSTSQTRTRNYVTIEELDTQKILSDTLDLRSRKSRKELARAARERWPRIPDPEESLEELLRCLLDRQQDNQEETAVEIVVTPQQRAETIAFLRQPNLVELLLKDFEALGYVGEEENKLLVYLVSLSRFLPKPLSAIILSGSGAGKSFVSELAERLTPPEGVEFYSRLSTLALAFMDEFELKGKLVLLEERAGGEAADYSIRTLQSKQKIVQALPIKDPKTGKIRTVRNVVHGPIAYIETTTNPNLNPENTSRCFLIHLDESREQTLRIQHQQRLARSGVLTGSGAAESVENRHHLIQRVIQPVGVVIPYACHLTFSDRFLRNRRDNERFLSLLEVVAFLHQYQRPRQTNAGQEYVVATSQDYRIVYWLAQKVLRPAVDELSRWARELLGFFCDKADEQMIWTRRELRQKLAWPDHRLRDALLELVNFEHLLLSRGAVGNLLLYQLNPDSTYANDGLGLLHPDELETLMGT